MKFIFLFLIIFTLKVEAKELYVASELREIKSVTKYSLSGEPTVYRALVYKAEEGPQVLGIEKYTPGEEGMEDKILFQQKISIQDIEGFKSFIKNISKKSIEATYGCCTPNNIAWSESQELSFDLEYKNTVFNHSTIKKEGKSVDTAEYSHSEVTTFSCKSTSLDRPEIKIICSQLKQIKTK